MNLRKQRQTNKQTNNGKMLDDDKKFMKAPPLDILCSAVPSFECPVVVRPSLC